MSDRRAAGDGFYTGHGPGALAPIPFVWLLPVVVLAAWWPLDSWWQSDDFIALTYAADLRRALSDFWGNQYGLEGIVWFYRPLITLSFAVELAIAGPSPVVSHATNVVAHAVSALLVALIARRFLGSGPSLLAGLLWGLAAGNASSILWAVGRVDSHTTVWILLSCLMLLRWHEGRQRTRLPSLCAFALALLSKESAWCVPGIVLVVGFATAVVAARGNASPGVAAPGGAPRGAARGVAQRCVNSLRTVWPYLVVLAGYFAVRRLALGQFLGGYEDTPAIDPLGHLRGLGLLTLWTVNPLYVMGDRLVELPGWARHLGLVPIVASVVLLAARGRFSWIAAALVLWVGCSTPAFHSWIHVESVETLRLCYLPAVAIALLIAAGGTVPAVLALLAWSLPLATVHEDYREHFQRIQRMHHNLIGTAMDHAGEPLFVAGLPRTDPDGRILAFQLGVDRLVRPPFVAPAATADVFALRPLDEHPDAWRVPYGDHDGLPVRDAATLSFEGDRILARLVAARLPAMQVAVEGSARFTADGLERLRDGEMRSDIVCRGVRAPHFRVTVFTGSGYVSAVVRDSAAEREPDGRISVRELLLARYVSSPDDDARNDDVRDGDVRDGDVRDGDVRDGDARNRVVRPDKLYVVWALIVPAVLDVSTRFPVLVEAGRLLRTEAGATVFDATRAGDRLVHLEFARDLIRR